MTFLCEQTSTDSFDIDIPNCPSPVGIFTLENDTLEFDLDLDLLRKRSQNKNAHKISQADFHLVKVIGKGAFGKVYLVRKITGSDSGSYYAMKAIRKHDVCIRPKDRELTNNERFILERIRHPFLVRLFYAFQSESKLFLILEYVPGGELFSHIMNQKLLLQSEAKIHLAQIALAIHHLHQCGIIYRDLKPENILRDSEGFIKITDFGMSKIYLKPSTELNCTTNTFCGTIEFMAPEVLLLSEYDYRVDWWSFGILTFYMLTGLVPFRGNKRAGLIEKIKKLKITFPSYVSNDARDLIKKCLKRNVTERITFVELVQHRFFDGIDWVLLEARRIRPPSKPMLNPFNPEDVSNFDVEFTGMALESLPAEQQPDNTCSMDFKGFTFVSDTMRY